MPKVFLLKSVVCSRFAMLQGDYVNTVWCAKVLRFHIQFALYTWADNSEIKEKNKKKFFDYVLSSISLEQLSVWDFCYFRYLSMMYVFKWVMRNWIKIFRDVFSTPHTQFIISGWDRKFTSFTWCSTNKDKAMRSKKTEIKQQPKKKQNNNNIIRSNGKTDKFIDKLEYIFWNSKAMGETYIN